MTSEILKITDNGLLYINKCGNGNH